LEVELVVNAEESSSIELEQALSDELSVDASQVVKTVTMESHSVSDQNKMMNAVVIDEVEDTGSPDRSVDDIDLENNVKATGNSEPHASSLSLEVPHQPILPEYNPLKDNKQVRDFQSSWFKKWPWLEYNTGDHSASCFACRVYLEEVSFKLKNWKKSDKLKKHSLSNQHKLAMVKWLAAKLVKQSKASISSMLNSHHSEVVKTNREYLKNLIDTVAFIGKQGISFRGLEENRDNLTDGSDINRGNFLELLSLRSKSMPALALKLSAPAKLTIGRGHGFAAYTSGEMQNE